MNDLTKAYLRALMYFYTILALPFAAAWVLYAAGADLRGSFAPLTGDPTGAYADCLVLILGVIPGALLLRGRMKANAEAINAVNEAPLSAASFQSLALSALFLGALGFGLFLGLAFAFLPYTLPLDGGFPFASALPADPMQIVGLPARLSFFLSELPFLLGLGAVFGLFIWGTAQKNKIVKYGAWAAFLAFVFFMHDLQQFAVPSYAPPAADIRADSPAVQEELLRLEESAPGEHPALPP